MSSETEKHTHALRQRRDSRKLLHRVALVSNCTIDCMRMREDGEAHSRCRRTANETAVARAPDDDDDDDDDADADFGDGDGEDGW